MTDVASQTISERPRRRVHVLDTLAVRGFVWLALAFVLAAPIAMTRLQAPATVRHPTAATTTSRTASPAPALPSPPLPPTSSPTVATSAAPSAAIPHAPTASVRDRLAAILSAYQSREDFGTPESAAQAAGALQWCARLLASYEHIPVTDASSALSTALIDPRGADGARVVSAIEASAQGVDETSRMHCASLLYTQANAQ